jgi:hypothetical protein
MNTFLLRIFFVQRDILLVSRFWLLSSAIKQSLYRNANEKLNDRRICVCVCGFVCGVFVGRSRGERERNRESIVGVVGENYFKYISVTSMARLHCSSLFF